MFAALRHTPRSALVLALVAFILYAPGLQWGAPHATGPERKLSWGTDDETPLGPLAELHNILEPKKDRNLGYPLMYSFMAAGAYAPYLGWLKVSGGWDKVSGKYPWGFKDPVATLKMLTYLAHLLTVLLSVGLVLCVYAAARLFWGEGAAIIAGIAQLMSYPFFYYGRTGNVDAPMVFFIGVAILAFAVLLKKGVSVRWALILGAGMGFAMGTKETCYSIFILMVPLLLGWHWRARPAGTSVVSWPFIKPIAAAALAGIVTFGFGSGLFVEPSRYFAHVEFHRALAAELAAGNDHMAHFFDESWQGQLGLATGILGNVTSMLSWPGLLLALLGLGWVGYRRQWGGLILILPAFVYLFALPWHLRAPVFRYVMPASPGIAIAIGAAVALAWSARREVKVLVTLVFGLAVTINALHAFDLTHAMLNDSRYAAGAWLGERLQPGDRIDYFGGSEHLPPLPTYVTLERPVPHMTAHKIAPSGAVVQAKIAERWKNNPPRFIVLQPDHSSRYGPHHHTLPPATFAALEDGSLGYRRVAFFETPSLVPFITRPKLDYPVVNPPIRIYTSR